MRAQAQPSSPDDVRRRLTDAAARDNAHYDYFETVLRNKRSGRRSLPGFARLVVQAVVTVWSAARIAFVTAITLTVLAAGLAVAQVLVGKAVLEAVLEQARIGRLLLDDLLPPVVALAGLTALAFAVTAATAQVQRLLAELVMRATQRRMLDVTTGVPLDAYETPWFFNYLIRVETNALTKPLDLVQALIAVASGSLAAAGLGVILLTIEPLLLPMLVVAAVPQALLNRIGSRHEFAFATTRSAALRERIYLAHVMKSRDTAKEVRAFDLADLLRSRWEDRYRDHVSALRRLVRLRTVLSVTGALVSGAVLVATMVFLLYRVQTGAVPLAAAGAALIAMRMLATRLQGVAGGSTKLFEARIFLDDLNGFLGLGDAFARAPRPVTAAPTADGFEILALDRVGYTYPGSEDEALSGVTLEIRRGEVVALVGENGSGKTTLAKLLAGLHEPTTGRLTWDSVSIGDLDPRAVRRNVAVIFQDFARYELSVAENIGVGRSGRFDAAEIKAAAAAAGAAEFVERLPRAYDTMLSKALPGGVDLSIGQWQRLALARAVYRDAPFVVLDEPTSALDPRAESELFTHIRELLAGRTVVLISHRFSSVRHADRILVLKSGRIIENGDHDELMAARGLYAELFALQAAAYLDE